MMEAGKNSVIYMGLILGPNKADDLCGKMTVTGTMHRRSIVFMKLNNNVMQVETTLSLHS
jgi:hypothetical protein